LKIAQPSGAESPSTDLLLVSKTGSVRRRLRLIPQFEKNK